MATLNQIISWVQRKYPKSADSNIFSTADIVEDLNDIHNEQYVKLRILNQSNPKKTEITTLADTKEYDIPTDCTLSNIVKIKIDDDIYLYRGINDYLDQGTYYGKGASGKFFIMKDNEVLVADKKIELWYYPNPIQLTADDLTVIPELDELYHNLLKYKLIQRLASQGDTPDPDIANYWEDEYKEYFAWVENDIKTKQNATSDKTEITEWW